MQVEMRKHVFTVKKDHYAICKITKYAYICLERFFFVWDMTPTSKNVKYFKDYIKCMRRISL